MIIMYKCRCMKSERTVVVTDRVKGSDISEWMNLVVTPSLTYDHQANNPLCSTRAMEYVKISVDEDSGEIGTRTELHS